MTTKKIFITGGATRIGAAIAKSLADYETIITIHYNRSKKNALKLKKELEDLGSEVYLLKADLNNFNQNQALLKVANKKMKGLNCLINNASLFEDDSLYNFTDRSFTKHLKGLNKKMKESAEDLEFEEAARIRDEIRKLEASELEITLNPKISQYNLKSKVYHKGR